MFNYGGYEPYFQTLDGKACEYNDVEINSESTMYVHTCLGPVSTYFVNITYMLSVK